MAGRIVVGINSCNKRLTKVKGTIPTLVLTNPRSSESFVRDPIIKWLSTDTHPDASTAYHDKQMYCQVFLYTLWLYH